MIIGISGKIGSGKDTVGKIIQYLTSKHLGNHTLKEFEPLSKFLSYENFSKGFTTPKAIKSSWQIKKFAFKLKQVCSLLTGISVEDFEKQEIKDRILGNEWNGMIPIGSEDKTIEERRTVRWLLQTVGTEAMRDHVHTNVWVNALFADYKLIDSGLPIEENNYAYCKNNGEVRFVTYKNNNRSIKRTFTDDGKVSKVSSSTSCYEDNYNKGYYPNWIITDMRFPNELEAVKKRNGISIRINRKFMRGQDDAQPHPSETSLDNAIFDYTIDNNDTIKELIEKVKDILIKEKII